MSAAGFKLELQILCTEILPGFWLAYVRLSCPAFVFESLRDEYRPHPERSLNWAEVGAKWVEKLGPNLGPKLGPCWPKLTPSGAHVAAMKDRNGAFGRCWDDLQMCRLLYQWTEDCSNRSAPLLNSHASAPSVQEDLHESSCKIGKAPSRQSQIRHLLISQSSSTRS